MIISLFIKYGHQILHFSKHTSYAAAYRIADKILEKEKVEDVSKVEILIQRIR